ncbi:MAG: nicotinamide riboside transporter PnuC [Acutalibacteraceae bacterium]|nr:nicotinamide riboside transporter PnuC [Acutalibacteraceae bacterium]
MFRLKNPFKDLNRFELALWITSLALITVSFLLTKEKDLLSLLASLIGATALIFVSKGYVLGQVLTVVFSVFYGIISFFFQYYGEMITYLCMTSPIALMSVISWLKNPYENSKEVRVSNLSCKLKIILVVSAPVVTLLFYFILKALGNANMFFSTLSVTTSFVASYLTLFRSPYYAVGYAANDIVLIILWVMAAIKEPSSTPMILCFVTFLANDLYGFYNWRKMKKRQNKSKK